MAFKKLKCHICFFFFCILSLLANQTSILYTRTYLTKLQLAQPTATSGAPAPVLTPSSAVSLVPTLFSLLHCFPSFVPSLVRRYAFRCGLISGVAARKVEFWSGGEACLELERGWSLRGCSLRSRSDLARSALLVVRRAQWWCSGLVWFFQRWLARLMK